MKLRQDWISTFACHSKVCASDKGHAGHQGSGGSAGPGMTTLESLGVKYDPKGAAKPEVVAARARENWDDVPTRTVKLSELHATEEAVKTKHVQKILDGEPLREGYDPHVVLARDGKMYVTDGNTRTAMHAAMGLKEMRVHVLDLSKTSIVAACYDKSCAPPPVGHGGSSKLHVQAHKHAVKLINHAIKVEGAITNDVRAIIETGGGAMADLDFRIKGLSSLRRKIHDKAVEKGIDIDDSASRITDAVRFTGVVPTGKYTDTVRNTIEGLKAKGYEVFDVENHWERGDAYNGLHMLARHPLGVVAEVQIHTNESIDAKEAIHGFYEEYRLPSTPPARKRELFDKMVAISDKAPVPSDIMDIGKRIVRPFG